MPKLHDQRREKLAQLLFSGRCEFDAYKEAGFKGKPKNCASRACHRDDVQARLAELNRKAEKAAILTKQEALLMLSQGARAAFELIRKATHIGRNGLITLDPTILQENPELMHAVKEIVNHADGDHQTVRMHSFREMIDSMAEMQGWQAPKRVGLVPFSLEELPDDQLEALANQE